MSAEASRGKAFDSVLPFRFLLNGFEAVFDFFWGAILLALTCIPSRLVSRASNASFWLLAVLVFGMAAFNRDFAYLGFGPFYITEVFIVLLVLVTMPRLLATNLSWLPRHPASRRVIIVLSFYLLYGIFRLAPSIAGANMLETLRNFVLVYYGIFGLLAWWIFRGSFGKNRLGILLGGIVILSTMTNTYFALTFLLKTGIADDPYVKILSGHAAVFSLFSALILLAALFHGAFKLKDHPVLFGIVIGALMLHVLLIFFSNQRSGLLALATAAGVMAMTGKRGVRLNFRWIAAALLIGALILSMGAVEAYFQLIAQKYGNVLQVSDEANAGWRFAIWTNLLILWSSSPIVGVGFSYDFAAQEPWGLMLEEPRIEPHNSYVAILSRTGIVGFGLVLIILWSVGRLLIRLKRQLSDNSDLFVVDSLLGCFVALSVYASMNVTLESPYHGIFFWLFIGMAVALAENSINIMLKAKGASRMGSK